MKKIVLTVAAMMSMVMAMANDEMTVNVNVKNAYDMSVNVRKLSETLGLTLDQMETLDDLHSKFCGEMLEASGAKNEERKDLVDKAVVKDLKYMRYILTPAQYDKYEMLLNATLANRGLNK